MTRLILFGAGAAVGYVLGARAGRERYDQIATVASRAWYRSGLDHHAHEVTEQAAQTAREAGGYVADAATAKLASVTDSLAQR